MKYRYNPLLNEAIEITKDLGDVTFIGAVAVFMHTNEGRESRDLDFGIAYQITDEQLFEKGYIKYGKRKNGYSTPRPPFIVDIYRNGNINGISIDTITSTAEEFKIDTKRRHAVVKAAKLEVLITMKYRANRVQDHEDLATIARNRFQKINWEYLRNITEEIEFNQIKSAMQAFLKI